MKLLPVDSRYELAEEIGRGGEARVFRARDVRTGNEVAVRLAAGPGFRAPGTVAPAPHPGWVRLLDQGTDREQGVFQVFELLAGETLGAMVSKAPLQPDAWLAFVRQSLDAVEALHAGGWMHGDLNADNFFATPGPAWKLLELPFFRFVAAEKRSALFGSIYTLAPEQLQGSPPDARSDLYALGCLYYYAASGGYPNAGGRAQDIAVDRLRFAPEPLGEKAPQLSPACADWVMNLLEREPRDRPADLAAARQLLPG
jgi:serine/threonine protein kinase